MPSKGNQKLFGIFDECCRKRSNLDYIIAGASYPYWKCKTCNRIFFDADTMEFYKKWGCEL